MTDRRKFLAGLGGLTAGLTAGGQEKTASTSSSGAIPEPARISSILFSCKYGMTKGKTIEERFASAKEAGFDGIDFDHAGKYTAEQVRNASYQTGLFVHNAINHTHWGKRFTSANEEDISTAKKNLEHCIRVSQAAGGSGVLLVIGRESDGEAKEIADRARKHISELLPLAAAMGQRILFENVWNGMFYKHGGAYEQDCKELVDFIDSFNSPWIGSYFDVGNHHRYGKMGDWLRSLGHRVVKLDLKGYNLKKAKDSGNDRTFCDITEGDIDWANVRKALAEINFNGWTTAEVGGGDTKRLKKVLDDMKRALIG
ncbi:MAG: sugar phosphate isomerase/epimerase [Lentisphaeraceae bacterium]|nr:sugar phosphate isomerase/epimerase [Lentisphaeraceae bacterium]